MEAYEGLGGWISRIPAAAHRPGRVRSARIAAVWLAIRINVPFEVADCCAFDRRRFCSVS